MKKLNFGCGEDYRKNWFNVDGYFKSDKKFNFNDFPYPLKTNSFDYVEAVHVLEHLDNPIETINELWRITKPNGTVEIEVPVYNHSAATTLVHKTYWNVNSIDMFFKDYFRKYPFLKAQFKLKEMRLVPTVLGRLVPTNKMKIVISQVLNIPLIFAVRWKLEVKK